MRTELAFAAGLAGAAVAVALARRSRAVESAEGEAAQQTPAWYELDPNPFTAFADIVSPTDETQAQRNRAAFLMTIRKAEGTAGPNGYSMLFGGGLFSGFADHPRQAKQFTDKAGRRLWTSAAGAYQFMAVSPIPTGGATRVNTWDRLAAKLDLPDFSPASQDLAAIELIDEAGALGDVEAGRFETAIGKVRRIWASLPGAGYSQHERSIDSLRVAFIDAGGTVA